VAVLLLSSFVKMATALSILRCGIGLHGAGFGMAVLGLALGLSLLVMQPQLESVGGLDAFLTKGLTSTEFALEEKFRPFLDKHSEPTITARFTSLAQKLNADSSKEAPEEDLKKQDEQPAFPVLIASFLVSELKEAFKVGFIILIPFLVIDLLVANLLMALGVTQISQAVVSLPLKILLFFALDGWVLVSEKLIGAYV